MKSHTPLADEAIRAARAASMRQLGISDGERRTFSLARAIAGLVEPRLRGYEHEVSQQLSARTGRKAATNNSVLIPTDMGLIGQQRDMSAATDYAGGYLVGTTNPGSSFIDLLRPELLISQLGATFMGGLRGDATIPRLAAGATANWLTNEATFIPESNQTIGQLALTPKNVGAYTEFSRQLLLQSTPSVDALIANDLTKVVAQTIDAAVFAGTGTAGQPTGIGGTSGIGAVASGTLDYAKVLEFLVDVAGANALSPKTTAFVTTPALCLALKQRHEVSGTYSPLWVGNVREGQMAGAPARTSANITAGTVFCGDWSQVVIGEWGVLEVAVNPFADFKTGIIGLRVMHTVDVGVRQPGAFSMGVSMT